jgi:sensor domain CHASE-containing protein
LSNEIRKIAADLAIPILIGAILTIMQVIYSNHPNYFPRLNQQVFEQLIQVNSTILGFTLAGMLYYLGKFDDKKRSMLDIG